MTHAIVKSPSAKIVIRFFLPLFTLLTFGFQASAQKAHSESFICSLKLSTLANKVVFDETEKVQLNTATYTPVFYNQKINSLMINGAGRVAFLAKLKKQNNSYSITGGMYGVYSNPADLNFSSAEFKANFLAISANPGSTEKPVNHGAKLMASGSSNNGIMDLFVISDANFKVNFKCD